MDFRGGLSAELNQSNNITSQGLAQQANVDVLNNLKTRDYNDALNKIKEKGESVGGDDEKKAFDKLAEYGTEVGTKYAEYNKFIKEGRSVQDLRSLKVAKGVGSAFGQAGQGVKSAVSNIRSAVSGPAKPSVDGIEVSGTEMTGELPQEQVAQHTTPQPQENMPEEKISSASADDVNQGLKTGEKVGEEAGETAGEVAETGGKIVGKIAGGAAKAAGGLFSLGMLSSDIYQQAQHKSFFYGENAGDKAGNFMSELGSVADVAGVASGDPILAIGGVALGAVGSVVSDISELFHHHHDKPPPPPPPPPKPKVIQGTAIQSIASSGQVAEAQSSTAR
jgi:hypothetical protein